VVEGLRSKMLSELLKRVEYPCIVYASTIKEIEGLKESLQEEGFTKIDTFHSKRHSSDRQTIQQKFFRGELNILLATSAFGMGINQSNIRTIIHYQLPQTLEDYVQQIGRAGRDLQFSRCVAFVHPDDFPQMSRKIERSYEVEDVEETELHQNIKEIDKFFVKGSEFTLEEFFNDKDLAKKYEDGTFVIIRLAPADYHRFHFPVDGEISEVKKISGDYYSVSTHAIKTNFRIFCENKREYAILKTEKFIKGHKQLIFFLVMAIIIILIAISFLATFFKIAPPLTLLILPSFSR